MYPRRSRRLRKKEPSAKRVFGINELLEMILLELDDPVEIIRAKRVCRAWRDIVQDSQKLQRVCWYQAQQPVQDASGIWRLNPAFYRLGVTVSGSFEGRDIEWGDVWYFLMYGDWNGEILIPMIQDGKRQAGFTRQGRTYKAICSKFGSWGTMLATQPPCRWMIITETYGDGFT